MKPTTTRTVAGIAFAITGLTLATAAFSGPMGCRGDGAAFTERRLERMTERLGLSTDQQDRIRVILDEQQAARDLQRQKTHQRIDAVLTQPQRDERDRFIAARIERRLDRMAERLELTADQTQQIRSIMEERIGNPQMSRAETRDRVSAVLTDAQRDQFKALGGRRGRMF
jgi:periplasmic protein CpxP/Spy